MTGLSGLRRWVAALGATALLLSGCSDDRAPVATGGAGSATTTARGTGSVTTVQDTAVSPATTGAAVTATTSPLTTWTSTTPPTPVLGNPAPGPCPLLTLDELQAALDRATAADEPPGLGPAQLDPDAPGITGLGCDVTAGSATIAIWATAITSADALPQVPPSTSPNPAASVEGLGDESILQETLDRSTRRVADVWVDVGGTRLQVRVIGGPAAVNGRTDDGTVWREGQVAAIAAAIARQSVPHL